MRHVVVVRFARMIALLVMTLAPMACVLHCRAAAALETRSAVDTRALHFLPSHDASPSGAPGHSQHRPLYDLLQLVNAVTQWLPAAATYVAALIAVAQLAPRTLSVLTPRAIPPDVPPPRGRV